MSRGATACSRNRRNFADLLIRASSRVRPTARLTSRSPHAAPLGEILATTIVAHAACPRSPPAARPAIGAPTRSRAPLLPRADASRPLSRPLDSRGAVARRSRHSGLGGGERPSVVRRWQGVDGGTRRWRATRECRAPALFCGHSTLRRMSADRQTRAIIEPGAMAVAAGLAGFVVLITSATNPAHPCSDPQALDVRSCRACAHDLHRAARLRPPARALSLSAVLYVFLKQLP